MIRSRFPLLVLFLCFFVGACGGDDPIRPKAHVTVVKPLDGSAADGSIRAVVNVGDYVYAAARSYQAANQGLIMVFDSSQPVDENGTPLEPVAQLVIPGFLGGLAAHGEILYVGGDNGTRLVDISDPLNPLLIAGVTLAAGRNGVRRDGDQLLVFDGNSLAIYDVSDPRSPVVTHSSSSNCWAGDVNGKRFVMGQLNASRFLLYDVSTPGVFDIYEDATTTTAGDIYHARILGENLYVLEEFFSENRCNLITYDLSQLDVDGSIAAVDTLGIEGRFRSMASDEHTVVLSGGGTGEAQIFKRGANGALSYSETFAELRSSTGDGFPYYGDVDGSNIAVSGDKTAAWISR